MNFRRVFLSLTLLAAVCFAARPALADSVLYDNTTAKSYGAQFINGVNGGSAGANSTASIANSFTLSSSSIVTGIDFVDWLQATVSAGVFSGSGVDLSSVSWAITTAPFGGTTLDAGVALPTNTFDTTKYGWTSGSITQNSYAVSTALFNLSTPLSLSAGTYFLQLSNLKTNVNTPHFVAWDYSWGPSTAYTSASETTDSNTFQILGSVNTSSGTPNGGGSGLPNSVVPEPPSVVLLGLGLVTLLAAGLFRKLGNLGDAQVAVGSILA